MHVFMYPGYFNALFSHSYESCSILSYPPLIEIREGVQCIDTL